MPFSAGDEVDFFRNDMVFENDTFVSYSGTELGLPVLVIEYTKIDGWYPNSLRQTQFGLSPIKKYLFVKDSELTAS